ncbi:hypothetical protein ES705_11373 [subsurface metagenome]
MKKIWLIGLIISTVGLWSNFGFAGNFKPSSEPSGFRGIKWGTDIKTLKDMKYSRTDPDCGGIKVYTRKDDDLHIGAAKLERIEYHFWRGKFCSLWIIMKGQVNYHALRDVCLEKFGKVDYKFFDSGGDKCSFIYFWFDKITFMFLEYWEPSEKARLRMGSEKISGQQRAYDKQKAKEGAERGF